MGKRDIRHRSADEPAQFRPGITFQDIHSQKAGRVLGKVSFHLRLMSTVACKIALELPVRGTAPVNQLSHFGRSISKKNLDTFNPVQRISPGQHELRFRHMVVDFTKQNWPRVVLKGVVPVDQRTCKRP